MYVLFWHKNIGAKAALRMLVKLTPVRELELQGVESVDARNGLLSRILYHRDIPIPGIELRLIVDLANNLRVDSPTSF
jgi:hypothetical protein